MFWVYDLNPYSCQIRHVLSILFFGIYLLQASPSYLHERHPLDLEHHKLRRTLSLLRVGRISVPAQPSRCYLGRTPAFESRPGPPSSVPTVLQYRVLPFFFCNFPPRVFPNTGPAAPLL